MVWVMNVLAGRWPGASPGRVTSTFGPAAAAGATSGLARLEGSQGILDLVGQLAGGGLVRREISFSRPMAALTAPLVPR